MRIHKIPTFILLFLLCTCMMPFKASADAENETPTALTVLNVNAYLNPTEEERSLQTHIHSLKYLNYDPPYINDSGVQKDGLLTAICTDTSCGQMVSIFIPYGISYQETSSGTAENNECWTKYKMTEASQQMLSEEDQQAALTEFTVYTQTENAHPVSEGQPESQHEWHIVSEKPATCAAKGMITYQCSCGATRVEYTDRTYHSENWDFKYWIQKPTAENEIGRAVYCCKQCNDDVLFVRGGVCTHVWNDGKVETPPTKTADGVIVYTCTICGKEETEVLHSWQKKTSESGETTYYCPVCGMIALDEESTKLRGDTIFWTVDASDFGAGLPSGMSPTLSVVLQIKNSNGEWENVSGIDALQLNSENGWTGVFENLTDAEYRIIQKKINNTDTVYTKNSQEKEDLTSGYTSLLTVNPACAFIYTETNDKVSHKSTIKNEYTTGKTEITVTVDWNGTEKDSIPVMLSRSGKELAYDASVTDSRTWVNQLPGDYDLSVPVGFSVIKTTNDPLKTIEFKVTRQVYPIAYDRTWNDNNNYYGLRPDSPVKLSYRLKTNENEWTVCGSSSYDSFTWIVPVSIKINGEFNAVKYRLVQTMDAASKKSYDITPSLLPSSITGSTKVTIQNDLKTIDWSVQKKWLNHTNLVVTLPTSIEVHVYYSTDNKEYQEVPRNSEFTLTAKDTDLNDTRSWIATITNLPAGYYYRVIEERIKVGNTSYVAQFNAATTDSATHFLHNGTKIYNLEKGSCYRYDYRALNSNGKHKTVITNTYNPTATPVTANNSQLKLHQWTICASASLLTQIACCEFLRRKTKKAR